MPRTKPEGNHPNTTKKKALIAFLLLFKVEKERTSVQNVKVKKNGRGKTAEEPSHSNESSRLSK